LYQQKNYPEAVVRLKRAVSVLPDKSAWWRASMWRLGAALEADGKDKEALDSYVQSYKSDRPNALRYGLIESLYVKVHGNREGLEVLIGANPQSAVSTLPTKPDPKPSVAATEPQRDVKDAPQTGPIAALKDPAPGSAGSKEISTAKQQTEEEQPKKLDAKALLAETDKERANSLAPKEPENEKGNALPKANSSESIEQTELPAAKNDIQADERPIEKPPIIVRSAEPRASSVPKDESAMDRNAADTVPLSELLNKKRPADSVETDGQSRFTPSADLVIKPLMPIPEAPRSAEAAVEPDQVTIPADSAADKTTDQKDTPSEKTGPPVGKEESKAEPELKKEATRDESTGIPPVQPKTDPPKADGEPTSEKTGSRSESANLLRDPFAEPASKPPEKPAAKTEVVVDDPIKPSDKNPQTRSENKTLFEPIIITVPQTWKPISKPSDAIKAETENASAAQDKTPVGEAKGSGATRTRLVDGKEVLSDQRCSIDVSEESISVLNGGGSLGVLVTIVGDGSLKELTISTNSPRDIEVRPEPEIEGLPGRRFYVVKSVSTRVGMYQVNFESPCGKKEIAVRVR
jgi:hypothetical protein